MTTTIVQDLAGEACACFETATRTDDTEYVRIKNGSPEWVTELAHHAHGDMLPDDWRYACIMSALECISDVEGAHDLGDAPYEWADDQVDAYTGQRLQWLASDLRRPDYCDEATFEMGYTVAGMVERIGLGQYQEALEVYGLVLDFLTTRKDQTSSAA